MTHLKSPQALVAGLLLMGIALLAPLASHAQDRATYHTEDGHNHYSTEKWGSESVLAGTLFLLGGGTNTHVMKLDANGGIAWETQLDFGNVERCFDVCVRSADEIAITGVE